MIRCAKCQTENLVGSHYCDECGASLAEVISEVSADIFSVMPSENNDRVLAEVPVVVAQPTIIDEKIEEHIAMQQIEPVAQFQDNEISEPLSAEQTDSESVSPVPTGAKVHAKLIIERGGSAGKQFVLSTEETHIGRWDADGGIFPDVDLDGDDPEAKVSRKHARILFHNGEYMIEDLGSTNGTFVNRGKRLLPGTRQPLGDGDEIIVGKTFLRFHIVD